MRQFHNFLWLMAKYGFNPKKWHYAKHEKHQPGTFHMGPRAQSWLPFPKLKHQNIHHHYSDRALLCQVSSAALFGRDSFDFNKTDAFDNEIVLATINYLQIDLTKKRVCNFDWYQFWPTVPPRRWKSGCRETWKIPKTNWKSEQSQKPTENPNNSKIPTENPNNLKSQLKTRSIPNSNWKTWKIA